MAEKRKILELALPAMAEQILQMLMGMVDTWLVAFLGLAVISGVSLANNLLSVYQALFIALGAAVSALVAKRVGETEGHDWRYQAREAIKFTLFLGGLLGLLSIGFGSSLLRLLGAEVAVVEQGSHYLSLVGGGILFLGLLTVFGAILRSTGRTRLPVVVSLLVNLLNVVFSAILVFGFHLGVIGVAVGTLLSRLIGCLILWRSLSLQWEWSNWRLDKELLRLALPAAGERLMMRAGDVVVVLLIVSLGTATVAGNAIGETLTQFNYMPGVGMATALVILVAQAMGKQDVQQARNVARTAFLLAFLSMLTIASLVFLLQTPLLNLYTENEVAREAGLTVLLYSLLGTPATAGTLIYTAFWQGMGRAQLPFYATTIGMWGIRVGCGFIFTQVLHMGVDGIWLATVLDNLFRWGFLYYCSKKSSV